MREGTRGGGSSWPGFTAALPPGPAGASFPRRGRYKGRGRERSSVLSSGRRRPPPPRAMRPLLPLLLLLGPLALAQPREPLPAGAQCLEHECFAVFWESRPFSGASEGCQRAGGHLMTVRSTVAEEAIVLLLQNRPGRLWLGLSLSPTLSCTEPGWQLRGFRWVTGDSSTDYTNWAPSGKRCGERCVTVSRELSWEERHCEEPADGFLCQYSYGGSCPRLAAPHGATVNYRTPFGARGTEFLALPPLSLAFVPELGLELRCEDGEGAGPRWAREAPGAWPCRLAGGGCAGTCAEERGEARCSCPEGALLAADGRGCRSPCEGAQCQHHCVVAGDSFVCMCAVGYRLAADGISCEDIDDCAAEPGPCEQECVNTQGGFECRCHRGWRMEDGRCQRLPACWEAPCEHFCEELPHGYRCSCQPGYAVDPLNATRCVLFCNTTECPPVCDATGCYCPEGFLLDGEISLCTDVDECNGNHCQFNCTNTPGSFQCRCPSGFHLRGIDCVPVLGGGDGEEEFSGDLEPGSPTAVPSRAPPKAEGLHPGALVGIAAGALLSLLALLAAGFHLARKRCGSRGSGDYKYSGPQEKELGLQPVPAAQKP
ncbi:PREDICTED: thrombomodulin [Pseudopodoces humilis]|uniref:thrombomodulin n=1 Tax=Pseudopodoces humilis TaxID=181119 RepID=UPI00039566E8|nr:PREDICTED: thrombomodulin [Pseudopodoces humilis]